MSASKASSKATAIKRNSSFPGKSTMSPSIARRRTESDCDLIDSSGRISQSGDTNENTSAFRRNENIDQTLGDQLDHHLLVGQDIIAEVLAPTINDLAFDEQPPLVGISSEEHVQEVQLINCNIDIDVNNTSSGVKTSFDCSNPHHYDEPDPLHDSIVSDSSTIDANNPSMDDCDAIADINLKYGKYDVILHLYS